MSSQSSKERKRSYSDISRRKECLSIRRNFKTLWGVGFALSILVGNTYFNPTTIFLIQKNSPENSGFSWNWRQLRYEATENHTFWIASNWVYPSVLLLLSCHCNSLFRNDSLPPSWRELQPFKDDRFARTMRRDVIKNLEINVLDYDDKRKSQKLKQDIKAREDPKTYEYRSSYSKRSKR